MECIDCLETDVTKFYKSNKVRCKKCYSGMINQRYHDLDNADKVEYMEQQKRWRADNIFRVRYLAAKHRAKKKGIEFNLTIDDLEALYSNQSGKCFYSGLHMPLIEDRKYVVSIDRIDSNVGYVLSNVVLVCTIINSMKNDLSVVEFGDIIEILHNHMQL